MVRIIKDTIYYVKCWLWKRHNRLHIKSLPPTYVDKDTLLEHSMFQILTNFLEKERPDEIVDWDGTPEHRQARDKMQELYDWWHGIYLKFDCMEGFDESKRSKKCINKNGQFCMNEYEEQFYDEANRKEEQIRNELTKKCHELIDIRGYLWT